jgi:predicted phosphodiesterase
MSTKIALVSDLHLDFADVSDTFFNERADVLVVAGDTLRCKNTTR